MKKVSDEELEEMKKAVLEDSHLVCRTIYNLLLEDNIGMAILDGYSAKFWLKRDGEKTQIKSEIRLLKNGKGTTLEKLLTKNNK